MGKILLLVAMIAVVWYGFKIFSRRNQNVGKDGVAGQLGRRAKEAEDESVQDMATCSVCGTFVPNASARNCGRESCPYPD